MIVNYFEPTLNFNLKPEQAIAYFSQKGLKPTFSFKDMIGAEHDKAFTVAKMLDVDLLAKVKSEVALAISNGESLQGFQKRLTPILQDAGWWGKQTMTNALGQPMEVQLGSARRIETIYRTNMQSAYAAGRWEGIQEQKEFLPFLMYDAVDDTRTRADHAQLDGKVFPVDHVFWASAYPPNDYNCRCGVIQMDSETMEANGLNLANIKDIGMQKLMNGQGQYAQTVKGVSPQFSHNSGIGYQQILDELQEKKIAKMDPPTAVAAKEGVKATKAKAKKTKPTATDLDAQKIAEEQAAKAISKANAHEELKKIAQGAAAKQAGIKKKLFEKYSKDGTATKINQADGPEALLAKIVDDAQAQQTKNETAAAMSGYKKKVLEGKLPTKKQQEIFDGLDEKAKAKVIADIDKAKAVEPGPKPTELTDEQKAEIEFNWLMKNDPSAEATVEILEDQLDDFYGESFKIKMGLLNELADDVGESFKKPPASIFTQALKKAEKAAEDATKVVTPNKPLSMSSMKQLEGRKGSNPGGLYVDEETGIKWYIKEPKSEVHAKNELLAAKLYERSGVEVPEYQIFKEDGKTYIASRIIDDLQKNGGKLMNGSVQNIKEGFVTDAWLANWDVVGLEYDNMLIKGNRAIRLDTGGALMFRAQGDMKGAKFGTKVVELDSLRDGKLNQQASSVFGNITDADIKAGAAKLKEIPDQDIIDLVDEFGPGGKVQKNALANKLIARKNDILKRYQVATIDPKAAKAAETKLKAEVKLSIEDADQALLRTAKGINFNLAKEGIREIDRERFADFISRYNSLLDDPRIDSLTQKKLRAHYETWIDELDEVIAKERPIKLGFYEGYKGAVRITGDAIEKEAAKGSLFAPTTKSEAKTILEKFGYGSNTVRLRSNGDKKYQRAYERITDEHKRAITGYTGGRFYRELNRALFTRQTTPQILAMKDFLNEALDYSDDYTGVSARGMSLDKETLDRWIKDHKRAMVEGKPVSYLAFSSSTRGTQPAFDGNVHVIVENKAGTWVNPISQHPGGEDEILIGAGKNFMVTRVEQEGIRWKFYVTEEDDQSLQVGRDLEFAEWQ